MANITISELHTNSYIAEVSDDNMKEVVGGSIWGALSGQVLGTEEPPPGTFSALIVPGKGDLPYNFLTFELTLGDQTAFGGIFF